jgi:glutamate-1-semialdehyde 2,1-aminomutase
MSNMALFTRNSAVMPGGLTSNNRKIDRDIVFVSAKGAELVDADGQRYIDYNCAFGGTILGHCDPYIAEAVYASMQQIDLIGLGTTKPEGDLAERLVSLIPSAEQVMLVNSGSEATYHALRLSRAVTGRQKIVKFQGGYHGWYDYVAMNVITPETHIGQQHRLSAGMLEAAATETIVARYNDEADMERVFQQYGHEIAAVIIEPIQHNIGGVKATDNFLKKLRELTTLHGSILIFDEVITCFRHGLGGYQSLCGIMPDLTTIGKAIANGMPISAVVGKRDLIQRCAPPPNGDVFLAGTFNGAPPCVAAAMATIDRLSEDTSYPHLYHLGDTMRAQLDGIFERLGIAAQTGGYGSVWVPYFFTGAYHRYEDLLANDDALDRKFRSRMIDFGCLTSPTPLKRYNFTLAHTDEHVAQTLTAAEHALSELAGRPHTKVYA